MQLLFFKGKGELLYSVIIARTKIILKYVVLFNNSNNNILKMLIINR
jgi:hypothetical protein